MTDGPYRATPPPIEPTLPRVIITDGPRRIVQLADDSFVIEHFSAETDSMGLVSQRWTRIATIEKAPEAPPGFGMESLYALRHELALWLAQQLARCR